MTQGRPVSGPGRPAGGPPGLCRQADDTTTNKDDNDTKEKEQL